jgi:PPP family 3-phenylpropionic acid transporter
MAVSPGLSLRSLALRQMMLIAAVFVGVGITQPFLPAFLLYRGLNPSEVALALAAGSATRLVAGPLLGRLADRMNNARLLLVGAALLGLLAAGGFGVAAGLLGFLLAQLVLNIAVAPMAPLSDMLALAAARQGAFLYGRARSIGSVAYIAAAVLGGWLVQWLGLGLVPALVAAAMLLALGAALWLPQPATSAARRARGDGGGFRAVLRQPGFPRLLLLSGLIQSSHAAYYGFGSIHWAAAGHSAGTIGLLWALGVVGEVALFFSGARLTAAIGARGLALLAAGAGVLRWTLMAGTSALPVLVLTQLLHALTFGAQHLAAMHLLPRLVPPEQAGTAQALHSALGVGLLMGVMTLASGPLYAAFGGGVFLLMAALCAAAIPLGLSLREAREPG